MATVVNFVQKIDINNKCECNRSVTIHKIFHFKIRYVFHTEKKSKHLIYSKQFEPNCTLYAISEVHLYWVSVVETNDED